MNCPRCGYSTERRDLFLGHLNRMKPCEPTIADVDLAELRSRHAPKDKPIKCACGAGYTHKSSYYRHKKTCQGAPAAAPGSVHVQNNVTHIGTQNNFNFIVMPFGSEKTDYIDGDFLTKCLRRTSAGVIDLLKHIHFNDEHKENQNIRIKNKKLPLIERFNGERWEYESKQKVVDDLFKRGFQILDDHYYDNEADLKEKLSKCIMKNIDSFMTSVNEEKKAVLKPMLEGIYLLILNNSYMVLSRSHDAA